MLSGHEKKKEKKKKRRKSGEMGSGHVGVFEVKSLTFTSIFGLPINLRPRKLYGL